MPHGDLIPLGPEVSLAEARLTARRLQEGGIPSFLRGEAAALVATDPDRALVIVEVDEDDVEPARRILAGPSETKPTRPVGAAVPPPEEDEAGNGLATVDVFYDSLEAQHAADLLRARGIPCALRGTSEGTLKWLSPGIARLRLEVHESDLERAFEILGFTVEEKEGTERDEEEEADSPDGRIAAAGHIQEGGPAAPSQLQRHPVQPLREAEPSAPDPAPEGAEGLTAPVVPPTVEAGRGGNEVSLVVFLLLVAGVVLVLGLFLMH